MNDYEGEKTSLQKEVATLTSKLVDAKSYLCDLEEENVGYKLDNILVIIDSSFFVEDTA